MPHLHFTSLGRTPARKDRLNNPASFHAVKFFSLSKRFTTWPFFRKWTEKLESADPNPFTESYPPSATSSYSRSSSGEPTPKNLLPPELGRLRGDKQLNSSSKRSIATTLPPSRPASQPPPLGPIAINQFLYSSSSPISANRVPQSPRPPPPNPLTRSAPSFISAPQTPKVKLPPRPSAPASPTANPNSSSSDLISKPRPQLPPISELPLPTAPPPNSPNTSCTPKSPSTSQSLHKKTSASSIDKPLPKLPGQGTSWAFARFSQSLPQSPKHKRLQHQSVESSETADSAPIIQLEGRRHWNPPGRPNVKRASERRPPGRPNVQRASERRPPPISLCKSSSNLLPPPTSVPTPLAKTSIRPPARPKPPAAFLHEILRLPKPESYPWEYKKILKDRSLPPTRCTPQCEDRCHCKRERDKCKRNKRKRDHKTSLTASLVMTSRIEDVQKELSVFPGYETELAPSPSSTPTPMNPRITNVQNDLQFPLHTPQSSVLLPLPNPGCHSKYTTNKVTTNATAHFSDSPDSPVTQTDLEAANDLVSTMDPRQLMVWEYNKYVEVFGTYISREYKGTALGYAKCVADKLKKYTEKTYLVTCMDTSQDLMIWELVALANEEKKARKERRAQIKELRVELERMLGGAGMEMVGGEGEGMGDEMTEKELEIWRRRNSCLAREVVRTIDRMGTVKEGMESIAEQ